MLFASSNVEYMSVKVLLQQWHFLIKINIYLNDAERVNCVQQTAVMQLS